MKYISNVRLITILLIFLIFYNVFIYCNNNTKNTATGYGNGSTKNISTADINKLNFINGYWSSNNDFAKLSEIDEMILNIDIKNKKGFLVIIAENKIVSNDEFDILLNKNSNANISKGINYKIEFVSDNINFIWNEKIFNLDIDINKGSLVLYHNDIVYASLYKDNKMSAILND